MSKHLFSSVFNLAFKLSCLLSQEKTIFVHQNSLVSDFVKQIRRGDSKDLAYDWIVYDSIIQKDNLSLIACCSLVSSQCVSIFCGKIGNPLDKTDSASKPTSESVDRLEVTRFDFWCHFCFH
jgi:hypothetical protein